MIVDLGTKAAVFGLSIAAHAGESVIVEETGSACITGKSMRPRKAGEFKRVNFK
jgi:hypothetical protein